MPSSHLILCRPLLLLPPIPPSIRVFSNESTLRMRWPKYWSFSFSISLSKEHPGLISFGMYICQSQSPSSSHFLLSPWYLYICSLCLCLYFCFVNKIIYTHFFFRVFMYVLIYGICLNGIFSVPAQGHHILFYRAAWSYLYYQQPYWLICYFSLSIYKIGLSV